MLNASPYLFAPFSFSFGSITVISGEYTFFFKKKPSHLAMQGWERSILHLQNDQILRLRFGYIKTKIISLFRFPDQNTPSKIDWEWLYFKRISQVRLYFSSSHPYSLLLYLSEWEKSSSSLSLILPQGVLLGFFPTFLMAYEYFPQGHLYGSPQKQKMYYL